MDVQLENVSPERGKNYLQMSFGRNFIQATQAIPSKSIHISESTPPTLQYQNPRLANALESQNTKRRKTEDYTATFTPPLSSKLTPSSTHTRSKRATTLGIDMMSKMWFGFHMHEALSVQSGQRELKESRTNEDFTALGTPATEIQEFR